MFKKLVKLLLLIFLAPFLLAFVLTLLYAVIPPLSIPVIERALSGNEIRWRWRSYANISPNLPRMIIAAEDERFCEHNGVDWQAVEKAAAKAEKQGKLTHGASTIPMQVAKNLFLWPLPDIVRKPLEVPLAMWMDFVWSKKRMIQIYMNIAEFGKGIYGAEAASQHYFGIPASKLNSGEAAALASILPNPEKRNPDNLSPRIVDYAETIQARASSSLVGCLR